MRIAVLTSNWRGNVDDDGPAITAELINRGVDASLQKWDDASVDWKSFDAIVARAAWHAYESNETMAVFLDWLASVEQTSLVLNSPDVIRKIVDKHYLLDAQANGVATVPTTVAEVGDTPTFPDGNFVIKPVMAAGGHMAAEYSPQDRGRALEHVQRIHDSGLAVLMQPFVHTLSTEGERGLIFFNKQFSHAIRKGPVLTEGEAFETKKEAHPGVHLYEPTDEELELAQRTFDLLPSNSKLSVGRVDLVTLDTGELGVMELEFIDPRVFIRLEPKAASRAADAIVELIG